MKVSFARIAGLIAVVMLILIIVRLSSDHFPKEGQQCKDLITEVERFLFENNRLPRRAELPPVFSKIAEFCQYRRGIDGFTMSLRGQADPGACSALYQELSRYYEAHKFLPDNVDEVVPGATDKLGPCNITRGDPRSFTMEFIGTRRCSVDMTGYCAGEDCRTWWQKLTDALGFLRPPIGLDAWGYTSRLGNYWLKSCMPLEEDSPTGN